MSISMTQPEGVGHQYTPPLMTDVVPSDVSPVGVDQAGYEYGQLCEGAVDNALNARAMDHTRANSVPSAYGS